MALYGMHGKLTAQPGQRDALVKILLEGARRMGEVGAHVYIVSTDPADVEAVWVYEVWESKAAHDASLRLDEAREAIQRALPLIAGPPEATEVTPIDGAGLPPR